MSTTREAVTAVYADSSGNVRDARMYYSRVDPPTLTTQESQLKAQPTEPTAPDSQYTIVLPSSTVNLGDGVPYTSSPYSKESHCKNGECVTSTLETPIRLSPLNPQTHQPVTYQSSLSALHQPQSQPQANGLPYFPYCTTEPAIPAPTNSSEQVPAGHISPYWYSAPHPGVQPNMVMSHPYTNNMARPIMYATVPQTAYGQCDALYDPTHRGAAGLSSGEGMLPCSGDLTMADSSMYGVGRQYAQYAMPQMLSFPEDPQLYYVPASCMPYGHPVSHPLMATRNNFSDYSRPSSSHKRNSQKKKFGGCMGVASACSNPNSIVEKIEKYYADNLKSDIPTVTSKKALATRQYLIDHDSIYSSK